VGGHAIAPAGSLDRSAIDSRNDVATFTSELLAEDLTIAGAISVELYIEADTPSFDVCAVLSEVYPDGRVLCVSQGYCRVDGSPSPIEIPCQAIAQRIARGQRLRLSVSGACFPAYPVNPGTGQRPAEARAIDAQPIALTLRSGKGFPSVVQLSVIAT
jgi:hypothetical protein